MRPAGGSSFLPPPARDRARAPQAGFWLTVLLLWLVQSVGLAQQAPVPSPTAPVLTNAVQVLKLSSVPTTNHFRARIRGTVTFADPEWQMWFIKDATGGLSLSRETNDPPLEAGMEVEIEGEARPAAFAPSLFEKHTTILGGRALPPAELRSFDQLAGGREDSQWIELEAIVRSISLEKNRLLIQFSLPHNLQAYLPGFTNSLAKEIQRLVDARVRVRGVCGTRFNGRGNLVDYALFIPSLEAIRVTEPPTAAPFDLPLNTIADPLRYSGAQRFGHRARMSGIVTARLSPTEFFMQDDSGGAYFQTLEPIEVVPGDRLEAAAFPEPAGATPSMMAAVVRKIGSGPLPAPKPLDPDSPLITSWDSTLASVEGELVEKVRTRSGTDCIIIAGDRRITLRLAHGAQETPLRHIARGARILASGICVIELGDQKEPANIRWLLSSADSVRVIHPGPWWTPERALTFLGVATLLLIGWGIHGLWRQARLKEEYRRIVDHATDLISTHDGEGHFLTVNRAWQSATGYQAEDLIGKGFEEMLAPGQDATFQTWWRQVCAGATTFPQELKITGAGGRPIWLEVVSLLVKDGRSRAPRIQSIGRDVTSRHRNEQIRAGEQRTLELIATGAQLQEVLEQIIRCVEEQTPGAVASVQLLDADGITLRHVAAPHLPASYVAAMDGMAAGEGSGSCGTAVARRAQVIVSDIAHDPLWTAGREVALAHGFHACWSTPIVSKSSRVLGTFAVHHRETRSPSPDDIALIQASSALASIAIERKRSEEALRQSEKMQAIGTLAGGIAHDFNNILAAILGNTEILQMDLPKENELQESLQGILLATDRARQLVLQILAFSRGEEPDRRSLPLAPVIHDALTLIRASFPASIEIRTSIVETPLQAKVNVTQVHQVLMNLCFNARQAMQGGAGRIDLGLAVVDIDSAAAKAQPQLHEGRYLRLTVTDNGQGMDTKTLGRIFEPFFTTKGPGQGTGLGLAVVHGILQAHEGAITVTSSPGKGSSFHLYFPALEPQAEPEPSLEDVLPKGQGERVLIVDDEAPIASFAAKLLSRLNYSPTSMTDSSEALAAFRRSPGDYDLVLADLTMPHLSGRELAKGMRAVRPGIPIILCSGNRPEDSTVPSEDSWLGKPFRIDTLARALHGALHSESP